MVISTYFIGYLDLGNIIWFTPTPCTSVSLYSLTTKPREVSKPRNFKLWWLYPNEIRDESLPEPMMTHSTMHTHVSKPQCLDNIDNKSHEMPIEDCVLAEINILLQIMMRNTLHVVLMLFVCLGVLLALEDWERFVYPGHVARTRYTSVPQNKYRGLLILEMPYHRITTINLELQNYPLIQVYCIKIWQGCALLS